MPRLDDGLAGSLGIRGASDGDLEVVSPVDGELLGRVVQDSAGGVDAAVGRAAEGFRKWRSVPGPRRGEIVRCLGEELRRIKGSLADLVTLECGKPIGEAEGEVQEMIDICDFACGLSRQLYGLTMPSERAGHHLREVWQPLGVVGVISAFNFPVAVWSWNFAIALVCGDTVVWKPSEKTPMTALACQAAFERAWEASGGVDGLGAQDVSSVVIGGREIGKRLVDDARVALVSATGSVPMGRAVGERVAARMGRSLLELGGNNAMIVRPSADLSLATLAAAFSGAGTAGQRCTSLRRLFVHSAVRDELLVRLYKAYGSLKVGDPRDRSHHLGPLIDAGAWEGMRGQIEKAKSQGGVVGRGGGRLHEDRWADAYYADPAVVEVPGEIGVMREECFAPILYVCAVDDLEEAITLQNGVPQGLSSCIFTNDMREAELFCSAVGSDCGIANVNIGTSGAEIGGAFGGEKETGGGRESGSDSWKAYMRRQTQTVNYSTALPLAQGISFEV